MKTSCSRINVRKVTRSKTKTNLKMKIKLQMKSSPNNCTYRMGKWLKTKSPWTFRKLWRHQ